VVAFLVGGKATALNILPITFDGRTDQRTGIAVAAHKLGWRREGQAHHIVEDKNLPIAVRPRANADGGNGQLGSDGRGNLARNAFENNRASSCLGQRLSVSLESLRGVRSASLYTITTHAMNALRRQSQMTHDGNLSRSERAHQLGTRAFDLDRLRARLLYKTNGVGNSLSHGAVITSKGHIGHQ